MNKKFRKIFHPSLKKNKEPKVPIKKTRFSTCKEDLFFTDQEEKEGGFWGGLQVAFASPSK